MNFPQRILIVGVPRSGTTLLQSLLAAHPETTSFTESHVFSRHFRALPLRRALLVRDPRPRVVEFLAENGVHDPEQLMAGLARLPHLRTSTFARSFLGLLDSLAAQRGAGTWIEKTPMHLRFVPFLERVAAALPGPPLRVVHVVRRGEDVVPSLRKASRSWEMPYDLDACATRWNTDMAFTLGRARTSEDRFVFYEELIEDPESVLEPLCNWLHLNWTPSLITAYAEASSTLVTSRETWKEGLAGGIRRPSVDRSDHELTSAERARLMTLLSAERYDTLRALAKERGRA